MPALDLLPSPLIAAPMAGGPTTPALVHAAAAAGAVGFIAAGNLTPEAFDAQLRTVIDQRIPHGANLFVPSQTRIDPADFRRYRARLAPFAEAHGVELPAQSTFDTDDWEAKIPLLAERSVPVVSFTFGLPETPIIRSLQRQGSTVWATVTTAAEARAAADAGVDALIIQGSAAGGHSGAWVLRARIAHRCTADLVREIRGETRRPLIAAGGVDGPAEVSRLLAAGADAVQIGTLLLLAHEAGTSATHRSALRNPRFTETVQTRAFTGRWARSLRNDFTDAFTSDAPAGYPEIHRLTQPLRAQAARAGDPENLHLWAGTGFRAAREDSATTILSDLLSAL